MSEQTSEESAGSIGRVLKASKTGSSSLAARREQAGDDRQVVPASSSIMRDVVNWGVVVGTAVFTSVFLMLITRWAWTSPWLEALVQEHFPATVGLPLAAIASLVIVVLLEARFDQIEMKFFHGFIEFRGAAGPIVLWGFCFLIMAGSIKIVW